jgi:uroporphyrinogen decarboxylase
MTSAERIQAVVNFQKTDRVPVIPQVFGHAAALCDIPLVDYIRSGELIAQCQLEALNRYGYDAVFALMDVCVETEAVGSELIYRRDIYPDVKTYALSKDAPVGSLHFPDPEKDGRMPELIKAIKILREKTGGETPVVGCVLGPMTLSIQLAGMETALYAAIDKPDYFEELLDFAVDVTIAFGTAQIEAGSHIPLVFDPSASPAVIPPQFFRELIIPRLKKIFSSFKASGAAANWLHITGQTDAILPIYKEAGVDIANFDYCVDPLTAERLLPEICLDGNIKPLSFVDASPVEIYNKASRLIDGFAGRGGFILSSGCEIPPESKTENIEAMVMAAKGEPLKYA